MIDNLRQDARYAIRSLRRTPGFTLAAILTLGLGVGANTAIFSIIRAVLLQPLPYADADRLVILSETWPNVSGARPVSMQNFLDWARQSAVFERMAAVSWGSVTVNEGPQPIYIEGALVSPSYFDVFQLHAEIGRTFAPDEDQPGREHVVVLSHRLWVSQFGSDATVVGKPVRLDGELHTVIGVMPARTSVHFLDPQLWRPLSFERLPPRGSRGLRWAVAKLKDGIPVEQARTEMNAIAERLANTYPESNKGYGVGVDRYPRPIGLNVESSLYLLFGAVGVVLVIACVNLANLALARGRARARDVAIRIALGAGRGQLIRQFLTEHLMVTIGGALCGVIVGYAVLQSLKATIPTTGVRAAFPPDTIIAMDAQVWLFALGLSVLSGIAFGLAPAMGATRVPSAEAMTGAGHPGVSFGRSPRRFRQMLVAAEVALAFVLLTGAALLIQSFFTLANRIEAGFDSTNVLVAGLPTPPTRFGSGRAHNAYLDQMASRIQALPGIREVAFADALPTQGAPYLTRFQIVGQPAVPLLSRPVGGFKVVSPSYFRAVGLRLVSGRVLGDSDRDGAPFVVVVNERFARTYFQGTNPVGQQLLIRPSPFLGGVSASGPSRQVTLPSEVVWAIVGVIADEGVSPFDDRAAEPAVYATREQHPRRNLALVVRTSKDPRGVQESIRKIVAAFDPDQALADLKTLDQLKSDDLAPDRLRSILLTTFAAISVALAALGLYAIMSHAVAQRTQEIGIRAALGATRPSLLMLIVRQAIGIIVLGLGAGLGAALAITHLLTAFLYGVKPSDPWVMASAAGLLVAVALVACYFPARRATRVDPLVALRIQ